MEQLRGRSALSGAESLEHENSVKQLKWNSPRGAVAAASPKRPPPRSKNAERWPRPPHFDFAGAWTVREQNRLLSVCFGLPQVHKA